ncbi:hypothetical protein CVIRNUC_006537 [Coccomyxa viridis]|uniref:Uncharacterized protein n=1 Tax=Coccomyxa viridis TaxID=1274662 RepID=A0AAV1I834_9CHLO|nr:hypothetical protein CVIRNUC_006537 [Coccomyxa viridis]
MDKGQSDMGSKLGGHIGGNESDSIVSLPKLNISLSHSKPEHDEAAIQPNSDRLSSIDKETEDILIVLSVDDERHQQLEDTALLWQGARLYVVSNSSSTSSRSSLAVEGWSQYENDVPLRAWSAAASRSAIAPFLAYRDLGTTFKWVLFGTTNTDTALFVDAAQNIVRDLDHTMPYFLSDNMWFGDGAFAEAYHPNPYAPACVPCNHSMDTSELTVPRPMGCPCRPELLCQADLNQSIFPDVSKYCGIPRSAAMADCSSSTSNIQTCSDRSNLYRAPTRPYSFFGDGGALLSIGLLQNISFVDIEKCIARQWSTGADAFLTACLWKLGIAPTSPDPLWHPDGLSLFDATSALLPDPISQHSIPIKVSRHVGNLLASIVGFCNALCQLELNHVASLHLNGGLLESADIGVEVGQLIGLLRTSRHTGLGKLLQFPDSSLERINQQLLQRLGIKGRDCPVTELASAGHISAALQAVQLLKAARVSTDATPTGGKALMASSSTAGAAGAATGRPSFSMAERAEVGATEGIAWELLWKLVNIKQAQHEPQSLTAMVNNALPSFLKGAERQGRNLESTQHVVQAVEGYPKSEQLASGDAALEDALRAEDFVVAIVTHSGREHMLTSSRISRQGLQTFITTNHGGPRPDDSAPNKESWGFYPDAKPIRSFYSGDPRAAIAPFQAYKHLGDNFKWLFYSDDDTVFFLDNAMNVVKGLDPDMPYFLTDNMWYSEHMAKKSRHPHQGSPQCVPCNYTKDRGRLSWPMPRGCPCTPEDLCKAAPSGTLKRPGKPCSAPRVPARTYSMHGGAGALISVGLLRQVPYEHMHKCIQEAYSSGGDGFITECLWEAGIGMTNPDPLYHPRNLTMFDPSPPGPQPDDDILPKAAHTLGNMLAAAAGICHGICKLEAEHTVSLHLRSRRVGSDEAVYSTTDLFSTLLARLGNRSEQIFEGASPGRKARHAGIQQTLDLAINVLTSSPLAHLGPLEPSGEPVQQMLNSAATGAAKLVARKLLDTLRREAVVFEDEQRALHAPAHSPLMSAELESHLNGTTADTTLSPAI